MAPAPPVLPGPIRQNAYVVHDLRRTVDRWLRLGIGPWIVLPSFTQHDSEYRGSPTAPVVSIAFANSGPLQIELIEQEDDAPSVYREFTEAGHVGFHHVAFWAEDFDGALGGAAAEGWPVVHHGSGGGVARFAYLDGGGLTSAFVEVMELTPVARSMMDHVRRAAEDWDGTDPVRVLG